MITVAITSIPMRKQMLSKAIESVLAQTEPASAISIAIDHVGEGAGKTRNRALQAANTEWTAFLDDDDYLYPHHLDRLLQTANETGADLVYPWFDVIGSSDPLGWEGKEFDPDILLNYQNYIPVTYLVRTELAKSVGGFPICETERWPYPECEDWGFLQDLVRADAKIVHLPERTWAWVHHGWGRPGVPGNTSGRPDRWVQLTP